jgi:GTP 3',8-cyclase
MNILNNIPYSPKNINYSKNRSLRIKVTNKCPFSCYFCHHEGSNNAGDIPLTNDLFDFLKELKNSLIEEIHLTGGEPTSFKELSLLVSRLIEMGIKVKITTNGHFVESTIENLKNAGLKDLNFSLHTLNPIKLGLIQKPSKNFRWGISALSNQLESIELAKKQGFNTKINTVIQSNSELFDIIDFCRDQQIELRILDDLTPNSLSVKKIIAFLTSKQSIISGVNLYNNSSSYSYAIETSDNYSFKIKGIRKFILKTLCNNCHIRDTCTEWFYGIRLESFEKKLLIRLCIHRQDYPALMTIDDFLKSEQYNELKELQMA